MSKIVRYVAHRPHWVPTELRINAKGDTKPGFTCTHQLENGNGSCSGNVFRVEDSIGTHGCLVWNGFRYKKKTARRGWSKKR